MDLQQIRKSIPHGGMKEIAERLNISRVTITRFFKGTLTVSQAHKIKILNATAEYIKEVNDKEKQALKQFENIIN